MASTSPTGRKEMKADNAAASGSFRRPVQTNMISRERTRAGKSPRLAPLLKPTSPPQGDGTLFSPTHMSPTDEAPRLHGQFAIRPSTSSQSLHAAFADLSIAQPHHSHHPSQHTVSSQSSKHHHHSTINSNINTNSEFKAHEAESTNQRRLSTSPPRTVSPRLNLPFIQTTFEDSKATSSSRHANHQHDTPASSSVTSRSGRGPFFTPPKKSLSVHHDSPGTSTAMTTPSSIGLFQSFHFSPARHLSNVVDSPATSYADSNDLQYSFTFADEDKQMPEEVASSGQDGRQKHSESPSRSALLKQPSKLANIDSSMLSNRLLHSNAKSLSSTASSDKFQRSTGVLGDGISEGIVNGQWEDFNALERRRESEDPHKTFSDGQSSQDGPLRTDARRQKEERLQSASVSNGSKILDPKHFPRQDLSPAYADKINEASLDYSNQTSITPESNVNNLTYKTASRETTPVYTDSQISESPGRMEVEALRSLSVPIPRLITPGSSATAPTTPSKANRASRPILARLNTSEAVKKVSGDAKADSTRKLSLSISRLMVNTSFDAPRSNTLSEGILPKAAATLIHPKNMLQDENQYILSKPFPQSEARHLPPTGSGTGKNSFEPSEILPGFLYLGPDISTPAEVEYLKKEWGIKRILNAAYEVEDGGGQHLRLNNAEWSGIERYKKISMRDTVEAKGVQEDIEEACAFIDDAKLHSAPLYVHCKAGKSRSVLLVMAYLIHSNRWTLPQAYSYVVERRQAVSPNIGFVAELMTFEQRRLNPKRSGVTRPKSKGNTGERTQGFSLKKISNRESLPTDMAIYPPTTLSFWDHLNGSQGKAVELNHDSTLHKTSANQERTDDFVVPLGITSLKEYIGHDGRYHARRPPADEKLQAPTWRATMAAVDSDHIFSFANVAAGASE